MKFQIVQSVLECIFKVHDGTRCNKLCRDCMQSCQCYVFWFFGVWKYQSIFASPSVYLGDHLVIVADCLCISLYGFELRLWFLKVCSFRQLSWSSLSCRIFCSLLQFPWVDYNVQLYRSFIRGSRKAFLLLSSQSSILIYAYSQAKGISKSVIHVHNLYPH